MDSSERLRRDQEQQARRRRDDAYDRRGSVTAIRSSARIGELTTRIEARAANSDTKAEPALRAMAALWPATIAAAEQCAAWTAAARADFVSRLEAMLRRSKRTECETLDALAREAESTARRLLEISRDVDSGTGFDSVRARLHTLEECRLHAEWLDALERINRVEPDGPFAKWLAPSAAEKASALAASLAAAAMELGGVAAAVASQASACRDYWDG
jgi:hypothetical protein